MIRKSAIVSISKTKLSRIEKKILNKGSVIYSNGGLEKYGTWINCVLVLAKIKEDLELVKFAFKKSLEFNLKNARSNVDDIKLSIGRLMLLSIIRQDVSEINNTIQEIKKLNKFDDRDLKNLSINADAIFGKITNNVSNIILFKKRKPKTEIMYIEENNPLYKIVSNFDDDGFLFNSTNFISNKIIFSDSGISENLIDVFKSIDNTENNILLEKNQRKSVYWRWEKLLLDTMVAD